MDYKALGQQIKEHRKRLELTQMQVAFTTGISTSFLGHIERGTRKLSVETLLAIAHTLHTTPDVLLYKDAALLNDIAQHIKECATTMQVALGKIEAYHALRK